MRSLFAKILAWVVLTLTTTVVATIAVSVLNEKPGSSLHTPFSLMLSLGLVDAQHGWETEGRAGLKQSLDQFIQITHASEVWFTDVDGIDLLTGQPHPRLIQGARRFSRLPFLRRGQLAFVRISGDGKYCFFVILSPQRLVMTTVQPLHLLVLLALALACYALAYQLTAPLRSLRVAVEAFGAGKLDARAPEQRHDEMGALAGAFNRMADRIQVLLGAERRLLLDISHELRSPLARLSVAIELARANQASVRPLDRIQKEADRLNDLISQMLQVTRMETQNSKVSQPVRVDELVRDIVNDCSIEASAAGCALVFPVPEPVTVNGDPELLRRAIENVLRNAIRYAPSESKIDITIKSADGAVHVRIRDQGPGVPEAALPHLFDPFFRVDSDRNRMRGGVGLGLSIARRAVELHRGKLTAVNANPGLQVDIELPV